MAGRLCFEFLIDSSPLCVYNNLGYLVLFQSKHSCFLLFFNISLYRTTCFRPVLFLGHHQVSPFFVCGGFSAFCNATKPPHTEKWGTFTFHYQLMHLLINPLNPELNPICYLLALLAHHFLHVSRIRVKSLTIRLLMSYIYGAPILDVSRSHTTTHHSR